MAGGFREQWTKFPEQFRGLDLEVRGHGPDTDLSLVFADIVEVFDARDIDQDLGLHEAQLHGGKQAVASGQKLCMFFVACCADVLHDASLDLSIDQHWIDDVAAIIYGDVTLEVDLTSFRVEFDYGGMSSKGEGEILRFEEVNGRKSGLHVGGEVLGDLSRQSDLLHGGLFGLWA